MYNLDTQVCCSMLAMIKIEDKFITFLETWQNTVQSYFPKKGLYKNTCVLLFQQIILILFFYCVWFISCHSLHIIISYIAQIYSRISWIVLLDTKLLYTTLRNKLICIYLQFCFLKYNSSLFGIYAVHLDLDKYSSSITFDYFAEAWEISKKECNKGCKILILKDEK